MGIVHISEAGLARNTASVLDRVRSGTEIVIERNAQPVAILRASRTKAAQAIGNHGVAFRAIDGDNRSRLRGGCGGRHRQPPRTPYSTDSSVLTAAERTGKNPRSVITDLLSSLGDTEATLSIITIVELAHGLERADSPARRVALGDLLIGTTALELGHAVATHNTRHFQMIPDLLVKQI